MIRIFIVGYSQNKGGVETYIDNLTSMLDKTRFEVIYSMPEMIINGQKWIRPVNRHNCLKYRRFWKKFYKENKFDVLYYNSCDVVSIDQLRFAKSAGVPVRIIHSHNSGNQMDLDKHMNAFHRFTEKYNRQNLHKYATTLLACSDKAGEWMFDGREYIVIRNGVDLQKYKFNNESRLTIRENNNLKDELLVGFIGRLSRQKNPLFVLDIMIEISNLNPNAKLVMIGDGELRIKVEELIKEKNLMDNVILTGPVDNVNDWLSAVDCVVMPSLFEGLPFVLVEAQAAGVPCVVSTGISEEANITGLVNYLSLDDSEEKWARKILEVTNKNDSFGDKSHMLIEAGYSIDNTAKQVSSIIYQALEYKTID